MLKIGITGGIGTGKSFISKIISELGYPVFDSDKEAKRILIESIEVHQELKKLFGNDIFDGTIPDTKKIAALVFNSKDKLELLNQIIHPAVKKNFEDWILKQKTDLIFKEAAILIESGSYKDCDKIIVVHAPISLRISRVMKRDNVTDEMVKQRMNNQMQSEDLIKYADFIIENDEHQPLLPQINFIITQLIKLC